MYGDIHISEAAEWLGVTPHHVRTLEKQGRIPPARRDHNGRVYSQLDLAFLQMLGVGRRPRRLLRIEDLLEASR